jgi:hypothetical protein
MPRTLTTGFSLTSVMPLGNQFDSNLAFEHISILQKSNLNERNIQLAGQSCPGK